MQSRLQIDPVGLARTWNAGGNPFGHVGGREGPLRPRKVTGSLTDDRSLRREERFEFEGEIAERFARDIDHDGGEFTGEMEG